MLSGVRYLVLLPPLYPIRYRISSADGPRRVVRCAAARDRAS